MTSDKRCFPAPWRVELTPGGYAVRDASGMAVAYVYARPEGGMLGMERSLTWDEARRIATGIAKLPELMRRG